MTDRFETLSRRRILKAGAAAGLGMAVPGLYGAAAAACENQVCRPVPSSGEALPVIGVGTNRFGQAGVATVKEVLTSMSDMGGSVIDTAAVYGDSEAVIGQALAELGRRDEFFVATKFSGPGRDIGGMASVERSLDRLQMDSVDLMFIHFVNDVASMMPVLLDLKEQGRARYIGITSVQRSQHPRIMDYMREYPIDFLQIDYSLGNRDTATDVLPLAAERDIAVMVAVPFGGRRRSMFAETSGHEVPEWAADFGATTWAQFFLKYIVSHPSVTCVIPGTTDVEHMTDNQGAGQGILPDEATRRRMEQFWDDIA